MSRNCHIASALGFISLLLLSACGTDLGPCDMTAATQIVYKRGANGFGCKAADGCGGNFRDPVTYYLPFTVGQAVAQSSCGNGGVCHSAAAKGALRHGAPSGLNFDLAMDVSADKSGVLKDRGAGHAKITEWLEDSWELVDSGAMPPGAIGAALQATTKWFQATTTDLDPNERFEVQDAALPALSTAAGKEIMRNWLACGAPVVNGNVEVGQRGPDQVPATWDAIYEILVSGTCTTCHAGDAAPFANGNLLMTDSCSAWKALVNHPPSSASMCASFQGALVVPNDPSASLLMHKLDTDPTIRPSGVCGEAMPLLEPRYSQMDRDSFRQWIANGALPPDGCE